MSTHEEALESIAERARRALQDNLEARHQSHAPAVEALRQGAKAARQADPEPSPKLAAQPLRAPDLIEQRLHAIQVLRELAPKRTCYRQRVDELSRRLVNTPGDSIHYGDLLQWLAEAHGELRRLESEIEEAQHVVRSTEWLVDMLADPTRTPTSPHCETAG